MINTEIKGLSLEHYDEMRMLLNYTFGHKYRRPMDFERYLPKMWVKDDDRMMNCHIGAFEGGKLCGVVGIYPLPLHIGDAKLLFATTGNVATLPEYEGRGIFNTLFGCAMRKLEEIGADGARLGGQRQRYQRFGFEGCGQVYQFSFGTDERIRAKDKHTGEDITFSKIDAEDTEDLRFCHELYQKKKIYVERAAEDSYRETYQSMCSKYMFPYVAFRDGKAVGYLCASDNDPGTIGEIQAQDAKTFQEMIYAWQRKSNASLCVNLAPYMTEEIRLLYDFAADYTVRFPSRFKMLNWLKITDALMKLKSSYAEMAPGEAVIEIEEYGRLRLYAQNHGAGCETTEQNPQTVLSQTAAMRLLFGPLPASAVCDVPCFVRDWLPLPLTWDFLAAV